MSELDSYCCGNTVPPRGKNAMAVETHENIMLSDLEIFHLGRQKCPSGHKWSGVRDHFLIHYCLNGQGIYKVGNNEYKLSKGQGFLICPKDLTLYKADEKNPWEYIWIGFNGFMAEKYLKDVSLSRDNPIFTYRKDDLIKNSILNMIEYQKPHKGRFFLLSGELYRFFYGLSLVGGKDRFADENTNELYIKSAVKFFERNYSRSMTIQELADHIGLERKYFSKLFKQKTGLSPQEYLTKYRIEKACKLLIETDLKVGSIAQSVGYEDALAFSKMFSQCKKRSPVDFRKALRSK
jgi:AraC-like DNA-binding protein